MLVRAPATVGEVIADFTASVVGAAPAWAEQMKSRRARMTDPNGTVSDPYIYYPGSEPLAKDEIRVIACGTGMPVARRGQGAACFVVELGNGDEFVFDIGSGSMRNIMALNIPADFLDKIFLSHLHTDHWGDLDGMWTGGRTGPLQVWGPSGAREDMGTAHAIKGFMAAYNWDYVTRAVKVNSVPGGIKVHEFDYKGINEVVYDENGVVIRSIPYTIYDAIRLAYDGPLSMADDMMVWNITRDGIRERMAVSADDAWYVAGPTPPPLRDKKFPQETQFILDGRWDVSEIEDEAFKEFRKQHGLAN